MARVLPAFHDRPLSEGASDEVITLAPLDQIDPAAVEALLDAAFGADRRGRTAYRLREGVDAIAGLSFAALEDGALIGSVQCWPVELVDDRGGLHPLVLVGPIAVRPDRQQDGIGRRITAAALDAAEAAGETALMLIGDPGYYERFFGFVAAPTAGWRLPGPVERHRLLARIAPGQPIPTEGTVRPRQPALMPLR